MLPSKVQTPNEATTEYVRARGLDVLSRFGEPICTVQPDCRSIYKAPGPTPTVWLMPRTTIVVFFWVKYATHKVSKLETPGSKWTKKRHHPFPHPHRAPPCLNTSLPDWRQSPAFFGSTYSTHPSGRGLGSTSAGASHPYSISGSSSSLSPIAGQETRTRLITVFRAGCDHRSAIWGGSTW